MTGRMRAPWRLLVVFLAALGAFVVALTHFNRAARPCRVDAEPSSAYYTVVQGRADTRHGAIRITLGRDSRPVEGAMLCITVRRADKPWVTLSGEGHEVAGPGAYEVALPVDGAGRWLGRLVVADHAADPVAVPVSFTVT